ncbi:enoyl-CoA hydratase/carnithine racemase [Natronocella acetinitrilica]|uniref:Enoyl-CoA hydratase/carnithine racemase n=1 Tax=Natronocella acetinitrilica TaxID=414046 RepID=A0AAE3G2L6_9GAMM|nr:crotonase/enoyl-CoA hydratase family protein [Natronocella acetinitrilica]MCP1674680.1 enoyl-CoA hydratase/carnithine racemase [Natronocella acetinitrilica]
MSEPLLFENDGHLVTLTMNRPETRNAVSEADMIDAIEDAVHRINGDASVRAVILTGAGTAFSSGGNLKHMRDRTDMFAGKPAEVRNAYRRGIQRIPRAMLDLEPPAIAAVNGPAIGAGCDLAMMCDLRVAAESAIFAESFIKVGIIPGDGGAWFLPRVAGLARASEMALTGDPVDARTALEWGLVNRVVPGDALMAEARALAERIMVNPPEVTRMTKRLLREAQLTRLDSLLELSAAYQAIAHTTQDHQEAVRALLEKRQGEFTGD